MLKFRIRVTDFELGDDPIEGLYNPEKSLVYSVYFEGVEGSENSLRKGSIDFYSSNIMDTLFDSVREGNYLTLSIE